MARLGRIPEAQRQLIALTEDLNTAVVTLEERSRSTTTTITRSDQVISSHFATNSGNERVDAPISGNNVNSASSTTVSTESVSKLKLQFSRFQKTGCTSECECTCHRRKRYKSPSFARQLLGEVSMGFSNFPLLPFTCSDKRCIQRSPFSATITYYLPTLFLRKMVSLVLITTTQGDPAACLKVRPTSSDFSIYRAVEGNNLRAVQTMVDRRQCHPSATFKG